MDTQRLILFFIFSFSLLLLWDAWEKERRPKPAPVPQVQQAPGVPTPAKPLALEDKPVAAKRYQLDQFAPYEQALADDPEALAYLASRGLTIETAQAWHFGVKTEASEPPGTDPYARWCDRESSQGPTYVNWGWARRPGQVNLCPGCPGSFAE